MVTRSAVFAPGIVEPEEGALPPVAALFLVEEDQVAFLECAKPLVPVDLLEVRSGATSVAAVAVAPAAIAIREADPQDVRAVVLAARRGSGAAPPLLGPRPDDLGRAGGERPAPAFRPLVRPVDPSGPKRRGGQSVPVALEELAFFRRGVRVVLRRHCNLLVVRSRRLGKDVRRVHAAVRDGGGELQVVCAGREEACPAPARSDAELRLDVLAGVLGWQLRPERETASLTEPRGVEQDAPADPCHAVQPVLSSAQAATEVEQVRSVVQTVALPRWCPRPDDLRLDRAVPELDRLLIGTAVALEAEADEGRSDEPAIRCLDRTDEALDEVGLEDHVVVEEQRIRGGRSVEQRLAVLGHAASGQGTDRPDPAAPGPQDAGGGDRPAG